MKSEHCPLSVGTVINAPERQYKIVKILGQGGFGITYLVTTEIREGNVVFSLKFALKEHFISALCSRNIHTSQVEFSAPVADTVRESMKAFIKEAQRVQSLGIYHPNIVRINEVFEANNTAYYIMEYLGDTTLEDYVTINGPLSPEKANEILLPIVDAVKTLHENKIAHYDIKPANIMLCNDESGKQRPILIDFGLAKHYDSKGNATSTIAAAGLSRGYAPIEQYAGISTFSPSCDVYALSATYYFVLTGKHPVEPLKLKQSDVYECLLHIAPSIADVLSVGLSFNENNRYADAAQLEKALMESGQDVKTICKPSGSKDQFSKTVNSETKIIRRSKTFDRRPYVIILCGIIIAVISSICLPRYCSDTDGEIVGDDTLSVDTAIAMVDTTAVLDEDVVNARTTYRNLDLCVMRNGKYYYFSEYEWNNLPDEEKTLYSKQGIILVGNGLKFMVSLHVSAEMDWNEAHSKYGRLLPTYEQGRVIVSNGYDFNNAVEAFGGDVPWQDGDNYWTSKEIESDDENTFSNAWYICMWDDKMDVRPVNNSDFIRVRTVTSIPD